MKKIKYLLGIFILGAFFGFSFGYDSKPFFIDYTTYNGGNVSFITNGHNNHFNLYYSSVNSTSTVRPFLRFPNGSEFNISNFVSTTSTDGINNSTPYLYFNSNGNAVGLIYKLSNGIGRPFPITSTYGNLSSSDGVTYIDNGAYIRVIGNENCIYTGVLTNTGGLCEPNFVFIHNDAPYTISSLGILDDSVQDGVRYNKGPVAPSVGMGYSFGFLVGSGWCNDGNNYFLCNSDNSYLSLRSLYFSGSNYINYHGVLTMRIDNNLYSSYGNSYYLFALSLTGTSSLSWVYSIYNCPSDSSTLYDCTFSEGGTIDNQEFITSFENSDPYTNLLYFITKPYTHKLYNSYNSNNRELTLYITNNYYTLDTKSITLSLNPALGYDVIGPENNGGDGNQYTGSQPVSSLYYSCLGPTYNTPNGKPPAYCFDSSGNFNADRLRSCFSDLILSGGELYSTTFCNIDGFTQSVIFTGDGSGVSIVPCTSDSCYSYLIAGESYINLDPVNNVTTGLVLDMITNLTGWVGRCPFPYVDFGFGNTFKLFSYFKSLGFNIDLFLPFNCAIAGFNAGRYNVFEDLDLTIFNTPILNGDTEKHKILFRFFDVLIIFAIFGIFRFFRKHI